METGLEIGKCKVEIAKNSRGKYLSRGEVLLSHINRSRVPHIVILAVLTLPAFLFAQQRNREPMDCREWLQRVDSTLDDPASADVANLTDHETLKAIECLLKCKGNRHPARFSGATAFDVSQILPTANADLAA